MCVCLNRLITGAGGALHRDEGDWGHSRIARAIRGMYDNKASFSPLLVPQICSGLVSVKKQMFVMWRVRNVY